MGTVTVKAPAKDGFGHGRGYLQTEGGRRLVMSFAPSEVTDTSGQDTYSTIVVPGGKPNSRRTGDGLRIQSFTFELGLMRQNVPIEGALASWRVMYQSGQKMMVGGMGPMLRGWWWLTSQTVHVTRRRQGDNQATFATVDVELTEFHDARPKIGGTSTQPSKKGGKKPTPTKAKYRTVIVKAGDTLWVLAVHYLHDGRRYPEIVKASGLRSTRLYAGQHLKVPTS